jgi:hypothetical protein
MLLARCGVGGEVDQGFVRSRSLASASGPVRTGNSPLSAKGPELRRTMTSISYRATLL